MIQTIEHLTITTGHLRTSLRREVPDDIIAKCLAMLTQLANTGRSDILDGFEMVGECTDTWFDVWVQRATRKMPLLHIAAVKNDADAPQVWKRINVNPKLSMPAGPWVAAALGHPMVDLHDQMELMSWAGDFERCLAWALVAS